MLRRVVVTGLGAVSPNGIGQKEFWKNTCKGISGIDRITSFDPVDLACQIAGEVTNFDPSLYYSAADLKNYRAPFRLPPPRPRKLWRMPELIWILFRKRILNRLVCW